MNFCVISFQIYIFQNLQGRLGMRSSAGKVVIQSAGELRFLEKDPMELYTSGDFNHVRMMAGTTKNEGFGILFSK